MYSFDQKKWKKFVLKQALYPSVCGIITFIIITNALQKISISELVREVANGLGGILVLVFLFFTWVTTDSWLEDRKRRDFPTFSITPDYLSLVYGLIEERVKTEHVECFEVERKDKKIGNLSIILRDGGSITLEKFFPIAEIASELRRMGINEL
ncbi:hypothetical protein [Bowmanella denitrificans]|uniref:hypothetical protein n=1 Tax=Bowmanella denitrificans TaxID=366582 RepID=UPI000C9A3F93|nr:hypothetical protein [Bowmanella denitrificans]